MGRNSRHASSIPYASKLRLVSISTSGPTPDPGGVDYFLKADMSVLMIRCRRAPWRFGIRPDASPGKPSSASTTRVILTLPTFPQLISSVITPPVVCSDVQCSSRRVPAAVFRRQFVQVLLEFAVEREIGGRERVCELVEATGARNHWGRRGNPGLDRECLQLSFAQTAVS